MLALTGVSTATLTLRQYGHGEYAWPFIGVLAAGVIVYAYLFTEGGVWNQTARDRSDMSKNYSVPHMLINQEIQRAQLAYVLSRITDDDFETVSRELSDVTRAEWEAARNGIDVESGLS